MVLWEDESGDAQPKHSYLCWTGFKVKFVYWWRWCKMKDIQQHIAPMGSVSLDKHLWYLAAIAPHTFGTLTCIWLIASHWSHYIHRLHIYLCIYMYIYIYWCNNRSPNLWRRIFHKKRWNSIVPVGNHARLIPVCKLTGFRLVTSAQARAQRGCRQILVGK